MEVTSENRKRRMLIVMILSFILLIVLMCRIGWIQFAQGAELQEKAYKQQTLNKIISPKRGVIYDATKEKKLAISATVETISINPTLIKDDSKEKIAKAFSEIFALDYNLMLEKVNKKSSIETIIKKIEKEKADELREWIKENKISTGINIDEDSKRYYPYENLASHVLGFCGEENTGREGIELKYDEILKGTAGKIVTAKSGTGEELPDSEQNYIPSENGSDIVLTINATVQEIAERYLKQAVTDNVCLDGGNVVIMNPKNGDVLAMATYPDYNLNLPFEPSTPEMKTAWETLSSEDKTNSLYKLWRNKAVQDRYEPGSTFKLIGASIGLEEALTTTDRAGEFTCTGTTHVVDRDISCLRKTAHGALSLRDSLVKSCNLAFMQLGQKIDVEKYYNYINGFGLMDKTGIDLNGEASPDFWAEDKVRLSELATLSFGQRFEITPMQLITSVSAIVNDGKLMQPRVVKQIINTENNIETDVEPVFVRQVISQETSEKVRDMMESVVTDGTSRSAMVPGYTVGGKTGTSEVGTKEEKFIASFVGISPVSSPDVVILITLYNPKGDDGYQGGGIAAPVAGKILGEVLPYLQIGTAE